MTLKEQYAEATIQSGQSLDTEVVLLRLKAILKERGHMNLFPSILRTVLTRAEREKTNIDCRVAKKEDIPFGIKELESRGITVSKADVTIDSSLVGGFFYRDGQQLIDGSYKRALINLYTKITK